MSNSFLRDSESRRNDFSLSVRDGDTVKHYRIRQLDEGGFFIARRTTFRTLQELVDHYSRDADGLCVNLRKACIQVSKKLQIVLMINFYIFYNISYNGRHQMLNITDWKTCNVWIIACNTRSVGNWPFKSKICKKTRPWSVWRSLGRPME